MSDSDDPCIASGPDGTYDQPLNIAAVFIILTASLLGTIAPLFFQRHPRYLRYPFAIILGKHVGTGVLLALALIHLLGPAVQTLTDECLPSKWSSEEDGYSYSPLFAMLSALAMHLIENSVLEYTVYSKQGGTESHSHSHSHGHGHGHGGHGGGLQLTELRSKSSAAASVTSESKEYEEVAERMEEGYGATVGDDGAAECTDDRHGSSSGESSQHRRYHGDAVAMKQAYQSAYDAHTKVGVIHPTVAVPDSPITSPTSHASMAAAHSPTSSSSTPFTALTTPTTPIAHHTHTHHRHHQTKADYDAADTAVHTLQAAAGHSHGVLFDSGAQRTIGAYILEFGLTAHSIIVGITVGVAAHSDLVTLIPALTFHQFFEGHLTHPHTLIALAPSRSSPAHPRYPHCTPERPMSCDLSLPSLHSLITACLPLISRAVSQ